MSKIVTKGQRLVTGATNPGSVYSRIVACVAAPKGVGADDFGYTVMVGEVVRLLAVKVFITPFDFDIANDITFKIKTGLVKPTTAAQVNGWEDVMQIQYHDTDKGNWRAFHGISEMSWEMNVLYKGSGRRFGCYARLGGIAAVGELHVAFQISEG
ncbi:unnamed protein product [marine sediment metagenome]|uniref:Uncharacterized protein n=1 Tax=marine sediment metagenome TaxID=412755 RepID=X1TFK9_9ZZZZ